MTTAFKDRNLLAVIGDEVIIVTCGCPEYLLTRVVAPGHYHRSLTRRNRSCRAWQEELLGSRHQ